MYLPAGTWRTSQAPMVSWWGGDIRKAGIENLLITHANMSLWGIIDFWQASDCWVSGVGISGGVNQGVRTGIHLMESRNLTIANSYFGPFSGGGFSSTTSYGVEFLQASASLVQNNIFDGVESPIMLNSGASGNVVAYNYEHSSNGAGGIQFHEVGANMNLVEGNVVTKVWADTFHGNSNLNTGFRNLLSGSNVGFDLWSYDRFYNIIGNIN